MDQGWLATNVHKSLIRMDANNGKNLTADERR
jgi:hypothetical protein